MSITVVAKTRIKEHSPPSEAQAANRSRSSGGAYHHGRAASSIIADHLSIGSVSNDPVTLPNGACSMDSDAMINPIHAMSSKGEVHIVKVTGDTVHLSQGPIEGSLINKFGQSLARVVPSTQSTHDHQGSLTTSPEDMEHFDEALRKAAPSVIPSASTSNLNAQTPFEKSTARIFNEIRPPNQRSTTETPGHLFTRPNQSEAGPSNRFSSYQQSLNGLLIPDAPTNRSKRRNTIGSPISPIPLKSNPVRDAGTEDNLADDIQQAADQIRRERMSKRAKAHAEAERALTRGADLTAGPDNPLVGNLIGEDHVNYVLMYNMLTGIRIGVSRCQAKIKRPLTEEDFTARHKFSFDIVGNELTPSAKYDFKFKDYAPWVFRDLREDIFYLDPADYLLSLTAKYILSELGSPGKSGSFFYFSRDYRFIIKTIRHSEHAFLLGVLKQYHAHVKANPHTLISRFYGLHRVKLPHGRKIHFVIMNNLFPPHKDIHETYDLKGSTIGRLYPEELAEKNPRAVLKDVNWIERGRQLDLGPEKRALLTEQLRRDKDFLRAIHVMDYSLLVGIHNGQRGNRDNVRRNTLKIFSPDVPRRRRQSAKGAGSPEAAAVRRAMRNSDTIHVGDLLLPEVDSGDRQRFIFYQDDSGLQATDEANEPLPTIYYLGVIDILTPYSIVKRCEHIWKGFSADRHKISPVNPIEYSDRFFAFMKAIMRGGGGGESFKPHPKLNS